MKWRAGAIPTNCGADALTRMTLYDKDYWYTQLGSMETFTEPELEQEFAQLPRDKLLTAHKKMIFVLKTLLDFITTGKLPVNEQSYFTYFMVTISYSSKSTFVSHLSLDSTRAI